MNPTSDDIFASDMSDDPDGAKPASQPEHMPHHTKGHDTMAAPATTKPLKITASPLIPIACP